MIDIENEIFTELAQALRAEFPALSEPGNVTSVYVKAPSRFPHVSITESDNYMTRSRLDNGLVEKYSTLMYEVNVYSNRTSGKKAEAKEIMYFLDKLLYEHNFVRLSYSPVPNMEDATIYRIVARYSVETDGKNLYRI